MKRFAMVVLAAATLVGSIGVASAQMHHGGGGGASIQHGGGGNWHGGGGNWHGGGGNWHGGGWHHGGHGRVFVGVGFGAPWWGWGWGWPGYYGYPYYPAYYSAYPAYSDYYPYQYSAPTYIQQDAPAYNEQRSFNPGGDYAYYCPDPAGYYPEVSTCAKGWMRVLPPGAPGPAAPAQR